MSNLQMSKCEEWPIVGLTSKDNDGTTMCINGYVYGLLYDLSVLLLYLVIFEYIQVMICTGVVRTLTGGYTYIFFDCLLTTIHYFSFIDFLLSRRSFSFFQFYLIQCWGNNISPTQPFGIRRKLVCIMAHWETLDCGPWLYGSSIINN